MEKRIKVNVLFFVILGAMNGAIVSLLASFFLDYIVTSYTIQCTMTYLNWLVICAPIFALIGALFNLSAAVFLYEDDTDNQNVLEERKVRKRHSKMPFFCIIITFMQPKVYKKQL